MTREQAEMAIAAERLRQVSEEGWTAEHDDCHEDGSLLRAAVFYFQHATGTDTLAMRPDGCPVGWEWDAQWWKPKNRERDLVRAGALCLAERDRLLRKRGEITWPSDRGPWVQHVFHKYDLIVAALAAEQPLQ